MFKYHSLVIFLFTISVLLKEESSSQRLTSHFEHSNSLSVNNQLTPISPRTDFLTVNSSLRRVAISSQFSSSLNPDSAQSP